MRVIIDRELCVGAGLCVLSMPDVFDQSDHDGRVLLRVDPPPAVDDTRQAVHLCPSGALSLADDQPEGSN